MTSIYLVPLLFEVEVIIWELHSGNLSSSAVAGLLDNWINNIIQITQAKIDDD
jgi:hypothetical protein